MSRPETGECAASADRAGGTRLLTDGTDEGQIRIEAPEGGAETVAPAGEGVRARAQRLTDAPAWRNSAVARLGSTVSDLGRYYRFIGGESLSEIAVNDEVNEDAVERSIMRGEHQDAVRKQNQLMNLRHKLTVSKEKLKQKATRKLSKEYLTSLKSLLDGTQQILERNDQGQTEVFIVKDNDALGSGLTHFRKTIDLEEPAGDKPAAAVQVNVNQNQGLTSVGGGGRGLTFEEVLSRIRTRQSETFIEATAEAVDENPVVELPSAEEGE